MKEKTNIIASFWIMTYILFLFFLILLAFPLSFFGFLLAYGFVAIIYLMFCIKLQRDLITLLQKKLRRASHDR